MSLTYKSSLPLAGIAVPLFGLFGSVLFELSLQLTAMISLSLSLGISLIVPTIAIAISIVAALIASFTLAIDLGLPSFTLNLSLAFSFELALVLGLLAVLETLILDASIIAYGWFGSAQALGSALGSALGAVWPDGTDGTETVTAYLFVATSSGPYSADQIESLGMMPQPSPPPMPQNPPPPAGSYPPPQAYEHGLAGVTISAPTGPGGAQATGHVTVDDSVATGIGAITGVSIDSHGSGYTSPATVSVTDTVSIVSIASGSPAVLTLPNALTIPIGSGFGVTIAGVTPTDLNVPARAKVLTATTVALYAPNADPSDPSFTIPIAGGGTGGTVTGGGTGAAVLATMGGGATTALKSFFDGLKWPTSTGLEGGVITFAAMLPTVFSVLFGLQTNLQARANLLGGVSASVGLMPPTVAASIQLLLQISANLKANLAVKLPDLSIALAASLSAQIEALANLVASIGFFLGMTAEIEVWQYNGPGSGLGAAIAQGPGSLGWHDGTPGLTPVTAAVFGLTNPASAAAFGVLFAGA